jgi:hypothetical protein
MFSKAIRKVKKKVKSIAKKPLSKSSMATVLSSGMTDKTTVAGAKSDMAAGGIYGSAVHSQASESAPETSHKLDVGVGKAAPVVGQVVGMYWGPLGQVIGSVAGQAVGEQYSGYATAYDAQQAAAKDAAETRRLQSQLNLLNAQRLLGGGTAAPAAAQLPGLPGEIPTGKPASSALPLAAVAGLALKLLGAF